MVCIGNIRRAVVEKPAVVSDVRSGELALAAYVVGRPPQGSLKSDCTGNGSRYKFRKSVQRRTRHVDVYIEYRRRAVGLHNAVGLKFLAVDRPRYTFQQHIVRPQGNMARKPVYAEAVRGGCAVCNVGLPRYEEAVFAVGYPRFYILGSAAENRHVYVLWNKGSGIRRVDAFGLYRHIILPRRRIRSRKNQVVAVQRGIGCQGDGIGVFGKGHRAIYVFQSHRPAASIRQQHAHDAVAQAHDAVKICAPFRITRFNKGSNIPRAVFIFPEMHYGLVDGYCIQRRQYVPIP